MSLWILRLEPRCLKCPSSRRSWLADSAELQKIFTFANRWVSDLFSGFLIQLTRVMELGGRLALFSRSRAPSSFAWKTTGINRATTGNILPRIFTGCPTSFWRNCSQFCLIHIVASFVLASMRILLLRYWVRARIVECFGAGFDSSVLSSHRLRAALILPKGFSSVGNASLRKSSLLVWISHRICRSLMLSRFWIFASLTVVAWIVGGWPLISASR